MITSDFIVLGCGWAGILASYYMLKRGLSVTCIEREFTLGGLLRSEVIKGFTFDIAGSHIIFSRNNESLQEIKAFLDGNIVKHYRKTFVLINNTPVPYPFENGLSMLPPSMRAEILVSFIEALLEVYRNPGWRPRNLREWIYGYFGKEIARLYLEPYNEKIWKRPLDEVDVDWVFIPGRLPVPDWRDVVRSGAGVPTEGYREQAIFYYPLRGGVQALYDSVLEKVSSMGLRLVRGIEVREVRRVEDRWIVNGVFEGRKLISTIPLNELVEAMAAQEDIVKIAKHLDYNSLAVVGVALEGKAPDMHWVYVPDRSIAFHRYSWISNYSPYNTPDPNRYSSILVEISIPPAIEVNPERLVEESLEGLKKLGVISESGGEILFSKLWVHRYAYPLHTIQSNKARERLMEFIRESGVMVLGRWGTWRYLNTDKILEESLRLVTNINSR